jgi:Sulfatase
MSITHRALAPRWTGWLSFLCIACLALPVTGVRTISLMAAFIAGACYALLVVVLGTWPERAAALDGLALLSAATALEYSVTIGVPAVGGLPLLFAGCVSMGTLALGWLLCERSCDSSLPRTGMGATVDAWRWNRGLALVAVVAAFALVVDGWAFGPAPRTLAYAWIATLYSCLPLFALGALLLVPGRTGLVTSALGSLALEIAAIWHTASTEVFITQEHVLPWDELKYRMSDPGFWNTLGEGLRSWASVALTAGILGGLTIVSRALRPLPARVLALLCFRAIALVAVAGAALVRPQLIEAGLRDRYLLGASAPWSGLHARAVAPTRTIDWSALEAARERLGPPLWDSGAAPVLSPLLGRYGGRSVVFVLMESQRACWLEGVGDGATACPPVAPHLGRLRAEGVYLANYFSAGFATRTALWTILTGMPLPEHGMDNQVAPAISRVGRLPAFRSAGYACDWITGNSPRFDDWDLRMGAAGARWWLNESEVRGLSHEYWTSWGMPDEQLYEIALRRYREGIQRGQPVFIGVLTSSNHPPFNFRDQVDGVPLSHDGRGGARYADYYVHEFVRQLQALPDRDRPIVMITGDHANVSDGVRDAEPMGVRNLEGLRIPGLLLLPDGAAAGQTFTGLFSHEDALDLLYGLVARDPAAPVKFADRHRVVARTVHGLVVSTRSYYDSLGDRWFDIAGPWHLVPDPATPDRPRLEEAYRYLREQDKRLWESAS